MSKHATLAAATLFATAALLSQPASAAIVSSGYTFTGNVIASGSGGCALIGTNQTFPTTLYYNVDSSTGLIYTAFVNIEIQNASNKLPLQTIHDVIQITGTNAGFYTSYDPQLFGASTAFTGVNGSFSGSVSFPQNGFFEFGTNFGKSNATVFTLTSGSCVITLQGVLNVNPN